MARSTGSRSRLKLIGTWLTVATALVFFTFTVVATAANPKPDYASAAKGIAPGQTGIIIQSGKKQVCSVNAAQYKQLKAQYDTDWMTVDVDGSPVDLVVVHKANFRDIRTMIGDVKCKLVQEKHDFYLPFDAQLS